MFTEGSKPTCFADSFENSTLTYWNKNAVKGIVQVKDGKLHMITENDNESYCYMLTALELTNFVMRVEVSHRDGNKNTVYGLRLNGATSNDFASFVINGNRMFGSVIGAKEISLVEHKSIRGAAFESSGQKYYYTDTLEVVKKKNSNNCLFIVNRDTIDTISEMNFKISDVGFFCQDSVSLTFDNFIAAQGDSVPCPIKIISAKKRKRVIFNNVNNKYSGVFDLLGRNYISTKRDFQLHDKSSAFGVYIDREKQESMLLQK
jgi:hypothetical protein